MDDYLYHYTNVETLALILSNRTLRFNSLENVDDLQEKVARDLKKLGSCIFVSCWTEESEERIPMWKMYGSLEAGVRIKLCKYPFQEKDDITEGLNEVAPGRVLGDNKGLPKALFSMAEMIRFGFATPFLQQRKILYKVEYTSEENKLYPTLVKEDQEWASIDLGKLGICKNLGWSFQKEWRYILRLLPLDYSSDNIVKSFLSSMNAMKNDSLRLPFSYIDREISGEAFSGMEITLSPKISAGNRVIVKSLVEKYNPSATIVESSFYGLIR